MTSQKASQRIRKLRRVINHYRYLYHVLDKQEISDAALDSLKKELAELERQFPQFITPTSPTQRVGGKALSKFKQIQHSIPMLSLQDSFSQSDLAQWEERNKKIVPHSFTYFVENKIDGVALSLIYINSELRQGVTRGDGHTGEDVTHAIRTIDAIPLKLRKIIPGRLEVRGEVYLLKKDFARLNARRKKEGQAQFANPRNIAAGSIRQLDPRVASQRPLRFMAWEITAGLILKTRQAEYKKLQQLGFPVPPGARLFTNLKDVWQYLQAEEKKRQKYAYLVDGAVIKINNLSTSRRLGIIGKAPRGSIAFKYAAEEATTTVENIEVQIGRTGTLTPVANLKPVRIAGTTVSRATLHNADEIKRKDVRIGDTVIVRKAGDIIPEVVKVLPRLRPRKAKPFRFPARCPVCHSPVKQNRDKVAFRCTNKKCFSQQRERILHAVGKEAFNIEGIGDKIIEQLLQAGLIKDAPDLWRLTPGDLTPLERFAPKKADNIIGELAANKTISLARFLIALGIPQVGIVTAQDLAREFKFLNKIMRANAEELQAIEGIGMTVAQDIMSFLHDRDTSGLIKKYRDVGITILNDKTSGPLAGQTFVFTGSLSNMTRDEAKQRVLTLGGKVATTVSAKTTFVVTGQDAGSKLAEAKRMEKRTLTEAEFTKKVS